MTWEQIILTAAKVMVPAIILLAFGTFRALQAERRGLVPWLFLLVLAGAFSAFYLILTNIGQKFSYYRLKWFAMVISLAILVAIPLLMTLVPYALRRPGLDRRMQAVLGAALGMATILVIPNIADQLYLWIMPIVHSYDP